MQRPEQHITETKSQRIFESLVPPEWVTREIKPDYGIDYIVEIFKNGHSTGKVFFVQLKGSTQEIKNDTFKKQFDKTSLQYYNSLSLPVLIILVSVTTEQTWAVWANNLFSAFNIQDTQQSLSVNLNSDYLINKISFLNFEKNLEISKKFGLTINFDGEKEKLLSDKILSWINKFYNQSISVAFHYLPNHIGLSFTTLPNDQTLFKLKSPDFTHEVIVKDIKDDHIYLHRPSFDKADINELNIEILKAIAIGFAKYNINGSLGILRILISKIEIIKEGDFLFLDPIGLLTLAKAKNELRLFNELVKEIINTKKYDLFFFFDLAFFYADPISEELQKYRIENLNLVISTTTDDKTRGTCYYNIGNILKSTSSNDKSLSCYFKARKLHGDYENRSYWWRELAGQLFLKEHFKWAETFYKKSLQLNDENRNRTYSRLEEKIPLKLVDVLIADCLFMQGRFAEAHLAFEKYLNDTNSETQEWILKDIVCIGLMQKGLGKVEIDKRASLKKCEEAITVSSNDEAIEVLVTACKLDPANSLAWFNLGVALDKKMEFDESLFSFIVAGTISTGDKEAQFNALTICLTQKKFEYFQTLIFYIIEKHGVLVSNDLADYIMTKKIPLEHRKYLIKNLTEIIQMSINIKKGG